MPAYSSPPTGLSAYNIQAEVDWGSAWPTGAAEIETSRDQWYMQNLDSKGYVGTLSPLFFGRMSDKVSLAIESADGRTIPAVVTIGSSQTDGSS